MTGPARLAQARVVALGAAEQAARLLQNCSATDIEITVEAFRAGLPRHCGGRRESVKGEGNVEAGSGGVNEK